MDQPNIMRRVRRLREAIAPPPRTTLLQLSLLQDRFGPSSLSGLAESAMLASVDVPIEHVASFTTTTTVQPTTVELPDVTPGPTKPTTLYSPTVAHELTPIPLAPIPDAWTPAPALTSPITTAPNSPPSASTTTSTGNSATNAMPALAFVNPPPPTTNSQSPVLWSIAVPPAPTAELSEPSVAGVRTPDESANVDSAETVVAPEIHEAWLMPDDELAEPTADLEPVDDIIFPTEDVPVFVWNVEEATEESEFGGEASLENTFDPNITDKIVEESLESSSPTLPMTAGGSITTIEPPTPTNTRLTVSTVRKESTESGTAVDGFRISRGASDSTPLAVSYHLTAFHGATVVQQEGTAIIPSGARHVQVAATVNGIVGQPEVVTLTVRPNNNVQGPISTTLMNAHPGTTISDAALFAAYRHGPSQMAFQQLLERHQTAVYRTAYHILGHRADAEDISQLVFLALARQEMTIQTSLHYWLQKVTRNASIAFLRAKSRRLRHETEQAKPAESPSIEEAHALQDQLQVALAHLPNHLSEAVRLRYLDGWTQQEAASIVGCPRGTISQRASQGLQTLRELLAGEFRDAG